MKRRKQRLEDSFDLFLDTITNTFGGVLLIALLIVLMLKTPKESAPEDSHTGPTADLELVQSEIASLESEKIAIETALKTQQQFASEFQSDDIRLLATQLTALMKKKSNLDLLDSKTRLDIQQAKTERTELHLEETDLTQKLSAEHARIEDLKNKVEEAQKLRTRTMRLPKERATSKLEIPIVIEGDELFIVNGNLPGAGFSINTEHIELCSPLNADLNLDSKFLRVKNGKGIPASDGRKITQRFQKFNAATQYFVFVVRRDSFESFSKIRELCVKMGFEYRLIPTDGTISDSGGTRAKAQ